MKTVAMALLLCLAPAAVPTASLAATPEQEKQFVDTYKKASEAKDEKTLVSLLYTKGADPRALAFYKMMMTAEMGTPITSIELLDLTAEDKAKLENSKTPDGKPMKLVLPAVKKLVVKSEVKDSSGSSSSSNQVFVAEYEGRLYIPLPAAAK